MNDLTLSEAYEKWVDDLVGFATALLGPGEAADVVADAFVDLIDDDAGWRGAERPRSCLFGVVANQAKMRVRSGARRRGQERRFEREQLFGASDSRGLLARVSLQQRTFPYLAVGGTLSSPPARSGTRDRSCHLRSMSLATSTPCPRWGHAESRCWRDRASGHRAR